MILLTACVSAAACSSERLLLPPDHAVLGGVDLHLAVYLNRDFQCCVSDGSLSAVVDITVPDSLAVPGSVRADSIWVVNGHETWAAAPGSSSQRSTPGWHAVADATAGGNAR
jgi:hypothetical protein